MRLTIDLIDETNELEEAQLNTIEELLQYAADIE